jgi:predicted AlkP superfamily pyrophosphatase or phosphodiesterase
VDAVTREDLEIHLEPRAARRIRAGDGECRREGLGFAHRLRRLAQAVFLVLLVGFPLDLRADAPVVILISWDGTRPDYVDRAESPALDRIRRDGVEGEKLIPVFPANTFPAHVSIATGTYPDRHGIVSNVFLDRERGLYRYSKDASWIEAEPVWITAERQSVRAAAFFWVGSETDWNGIGATYRRTPFDSGLPESEKVEQTLGWMDLPEKERPRLILSWWHGCDSVGHRWGPDHARVDAQLTAQDRELGRLLEGLDAREVWPYTTLLLVSDHGMTVVDEALDLRGHLEEKGISAKVINAGGIAHVFFEGDDSVIVEALSDVEGITLYRKADIPKELRTNFPARTGDVVALTDPPRRFSRRSLGDRMMKGAVRLLGGSPGMHGYDPERDDMGGFFFAMGRGVPKGRKLGPQRAIDVAPTITRLLGIDPPRDSEGEPIAEIRP